jgi:glycine/serine hydroxymethyltransferase
MDIKKLISNLRDEEGDNNSFLHLTANEARLSKTARSFLDTQFAERYYMGKGDMGIVDLQPFTARGMSAVYDIITAAEDATKKMLNAASVNLSCLSGVHAMMCSYLSTTKPGDTVMTVAPKDGGHFATEGIIESTGRKQVFAAYDLENLKFDAKATAKVYHDSNARLFYMDVSYYVNPHNLEELRNELGDDAVIIYDASHTMGLILGGHFQDPLAEGADAISANTHKTLPGPHKGMIAFRDKEFADRANEIIDGSLYSTPQMHHLIALSITLLEMAEFGKEYSTQVVNNANAVGEAFSKLGYDVRKSNTGKYSDNHQAHIFIDDKGDRLKLYQSLLDNNISTNFDVILGGRLYIRFGTQEITRRGMKESEMNEIAHIIDSAFKGKNVLNEVRYLNGRFPNIEYSFDNLL